MKYFSMFSGIGGFELGIQRMCIENKRQSKGMEIRDKNRQVDEQFNGSSKRFTCVGYSEIDKYAIQIYEKHFKEHKNYGDSTKIIWESVPDFDFLVAGFPCQSFSIAGKRLGFNDTRGTLFFEIERACREKKPKYILLENVKGLLNHESGKTFSTILKVLTDLGYILQWEVLNSKNFSVPQNRERVFIIGNLRGTSRPEVFPIGQSYSKNNGKVARALNSSDWRGCNRNQQMNAVIYQLNKPKHSNSRVYDEKGISPSLNTMQGGSRQPFVAMRWERSEKGKEERKKAKKELGKDYTPFNKDSRQLVFSEENISGCLTNALNKDSLLGNNSKIRRLTPLECERLQGFPDGWTEGISDGQRYKCLGNAVTVNVVEHIMEKLIKEIKDDCLQVCDKRKQ